MNNGAGSFIAIEGGEGAGKGSVLADLAGRLRAKGFEVVTTREPGGTPEGLELRAVLLGANRSWHPWAELLMMTAARVQHVCNLILPAIAQGNIVISDRFVGSTIAYQGAGRGMPIDEIARLHRIAVGDLWPDLMIILDVEPAIGLRRSLARLQMEKLDEGRFEALDVAFHARVRESFIAQAAAKPQAHVVIDASKDFAAVCDAVADAVFSWLDRRSS